MEKEVGKNVAACTVCARNTPGTPQQGSYAPFQCLIAPGLVSLDFVTSSPLSEGNTTILEVVDRFSMMVNFVPLPKLPSTKEMAKVMLRHVFRLNEFPKMWC